MTILEIILTGILWTAYGAFAAYQSRESIGNEEGLIALYFIYIICSPIVFLIKAIYGVFKEYK